MAGIKLSEQEQKVLSELHFDADVPLAKVAKRVGMREHSVRYCVRSLEERGIIKQQYLINWSLFGLNEFSVLFSLSNDGNCSKRQLIEKLDRYEQIGCIEECGGEYRYHLDVVARNPHELVNLVAKIAAECRMKIVRKSIAIEIAWYEFAKKYLGRAPSRPQFISSPPNGSSYNGLDAMDAKLLRLLHAGLHRSTTALARELSIPISTLAYRIKQLRARGIISRCVLSFNSVSLGIHRYRLLLFTNGNSPELAQELFKFCQAHPHIQSLTWGLGEWDFSISGEVFDAKEITAIADGLFEKFGTSVTDIKMLPVIDTIKEAAPFYPIKPDSPEEKLLRFGGEAAALYC